MRMCGNSSVFDPYAQEGAIAVTVKVIEKHEQQKAIDYIHFLRRNVL